MGEGEMPGQGSPVSVPSPGAVRRYIGQLDEAVDSVLVPVVRTLREGATAVYSQASTLPSLASQAGTQADRMAQVAAESVAMPLAYVRHSPDIPPQAVIGGAAATGVLTAIGLAKWNKVGRIRKAVYLVRQPALQVGATLLFVYPQYLAQQCGLRTHK